MERVSEIRARRERVFYKNRMIGKRAREVAAARKLVAENEHLLPRLRGSEKRRLLAGAAAKSSVHVEELEGEALAGKSKHGKALEATAPRLRVRIDGGVEQFTGPTEGIPEGYNEEDGEDDDDDDMEMD